MGEIILPNAVVRREGYLYYVDGEGNVCEAKLSRGSKPKVKEDEQEDAPKEEKKAEWKSI